MNTESSNSLGGSLSDMFPPYKKKKREQARKSTFSLLLCHIV
jgi:hypothetical protein